MIEAVDIAPHYQNTMPSNGNSVEKSYQDVEIASANEIEFGSHQAEGQAVEHEIFSGINKKTVLAFLVWLLSLTAQESFTDRSDPRPSALS